MPVVTNVYGNIPQRIGAFAYGEFLSHAMPILVLERWLDSKPMPKNQGDTIKFRRCIPFDVTTVPLQEGVTPPPQGIQFEDVQTSMKQYGGWVPVTDVLNTLHEDPILGKISGLCGEQAAETRELLTWGVLRGGTSVYYGSTSASPTVRTDVNDTITLNLQRKIVKFLKNQRAQKITEMLKPSTKIATEPVEAAYIGITHTDMEPDIRELDTFTKTVKYSSGAMVDPHEFGGVEEVRYITSQVLIPWTGAGSTTLNGMTNTNSAVDVYPIIYLGKEAAGNVPLRGVEAVTMIVRPPGPENASSVDPLAQRGFISWKMWWAALRLNENWMARAEVGATEL